MAFSSRLPSDIQPNPLSMALARMRAEDMDILDLTVSNPTACGFRYPEALIRSALSPEEVLHYKPDAQGNPKAREAIAEYHGHGLLQEDLLLTASTSESYALLFKLLGNPGDEIIIPTPSYPLFQWLTRLEGLKAVKVPAWFHDRWALDITGIEEACTARTRALCVVNPNNPTGQYLSRKEWQALTHLCAQKGLSLIVDEVFSDFPLEPESDYLPTVLEDLAPACPVFLLSGLSKTALLPQVKLGWIATRGPGAREALDALAFIADQYLSVSSPAQCATPALLQLAPGMRRQVRERTMENLAALDGWLMEERSCSRLPVGGGWSVLLRRPALETDEAFAQRLLLEERVLIHPGHLFDVPEAGLLGLSLLPPTESFKMGLERLSHPLRNR